MTTPTHDFLIDARMLPFVVGFQICRICIHHLVATLVTPAASSLLFPLANLKRVNSWWMLVESAFFPGTASWTSASAGLLLGLVDALEDDSDSWIPGWRQMRREDRVLRWHCTQERLKVGFLLNLFSTVYNVQVTIHTHLLNGWNNAFRKKDFEWTMGSRKVCADSCCASPVSSPECIHH